MFSKYSQIVHSSVGMWVIWIPPCLNRDAVWKTELFTWLRGLLQLTVGNTLSTLYTPWCSYNGNITTGLCIRQWLRQKVNWRFNSRDNVGCQLWRFGTIWRVSISVLFCSEYHQCTGPKIDISPIPKPEQSPSPPIGCYKKGKIEVSVIDSALTRNTAWQAVCNVSTLDCNI